MRPGHGKEGVARPCLNPRTSHRRQGREGTREEEATAALSPVRRHGWLLHGGVSLTHRGSRLRNRHRHRRRLEEEPRARARAPNRVEPSLNLSAETRRRRRGIGLMRRLSGNRGEERNWTPHLLRRFSSEDLGIWRIFGKRQDDRCGWPRAAGACPFELGGAVFCCHA